MQRVVRWVAIDGGRRWQRGNGPVSGWDGATLRPTGVVVFATLDRAPRRPDALRPASPAASPAGVWRVRARRGAAWLLGR
jgi:hypothetical protein